MPGNPEFDIYQDLNQKVEIAASGVEAPEDVPDDLAAVVQAEIGNVPGDEDPIPDDLDLDPSQATDLDELKQILENVQNTARKKYEQIHQDKIAAIQHVSNTAKGTVAQNSQAARASTQQSDKAILDEATSKMKKGYYTDSLNIIDHHAPPNSKISLRKALEETVIEQAISKYNQGYSTDAQNHIKHFATAASQPDMLAALDTLILDTVIKKYNQGYYIDALEHIENFATAASQPDMLAALDILVLNTAIKKFKQGYHTDAQNHIRDFATPTAQPDMLAALDCLVLATAEDKKQKGYITDAKSLIDTHATGQSAPYIRSALGL